MSKLLTDAYTKRAQEAEDELGRELCAQALGIAADLYSRRQTRAMGKIARVPDSKRTRVLKIAGELAEILRSAEPPAMRKM